FLKRFVFTLALSDSARMEALVTSSAFDWTIVRPPRLLNGAGNETFRARENHLPAGGRSIARVDLARFLVDETERHGHGRAIVGVAS
ncbi:MAG: NAD(P)H-binding protein, partial [Polyangiaceae bacterium]